MPAAWAIKDSDGHLLPGVIGGSRMEVGRKIVPTRYDAFRLLVSSSYREMFDRDLRKVLTKNNWQIVRVKARSRRSAADAHVKAGADVPVAGPAVFKGGRHAENLAAIRAAAAS